MNAFVPDGRSFEPDVMMTRIMVLVADGVSLTTLSSTLEPLQQVNTMLGRGRFELQLVSLREQDPVTLAGVSIACHARANDVLMQCDILGRPDHVILCSGQVLSVQDKDRMRDFVQKLAQSSVPFFAIGAACTAAVAAGLIKGDTCAAHWKTIGPLGECFPEIKFENILFARDGKNTSCAGELAAFDLIVGFIEQTCGPRISSEICNHFLASGQRGGATAQLLSGDALVCDDERFQHVLRIMIEMIETPLSMAEIAHRVGLSTRQIERIFASHGFEPPLKYYIKLRLIRARQLLEQTRMPLTEVALACGFESVSVFSKNYKRLYGITPRQMRAGVTEQRADYLGASTGVWT